MAKFSVAILTVNPPGAGGDPAASFLKVDGRESLLKCVELFLNRPEVVQVRVVFTAAAVEEGKKKFGGHLGLFEVKVLTGGPRWIDQIAACQQNLATDATHLLIHDATRPATPYTDIDAILNAAETGKQSCFALTAPVPNPLVQIDEGKNAMAFESGNEFLQLLTPQIFTRAQLDEIAKTKSPPHASKFHLIAGSPLNLRLASASDERLVKAMLNLMPKPKVKAITNPFEEAQW